MAGLTEALTGLYPANRASLFNRWCVFPKVMQGQQQVMAHRSMGWKQEKKPVAHSVEPVGFVMAEGSFMVFCALATQWSTSCCMADFWVGAVMIGVGWVFLVGGTGS